MVINQAVILICTHNPDPDKLYKVLNAIYANSGSYRIVIIDNSSDNSIDWDFSNVFPYSLIREDRLGNSFARWTALKQVQKNELAIFVDDDNYIADDYISQALKLVHKNSKWGCFGGRQFPNPDTRISSYFHDFLPYVGIRDLGELEISQLASGSWQPIEPIGAGMCLHPEVVHQFLDYILEDPTKYFSLGRKGKGLLSGEDSFIARQASFIGMYWGYSPDLKMIHDINISRLKLLYFVRLIFNYGRSDVILDSALGVQPSHPYPDNLLDVLIRILYSGRKALLGFLMGLRALGQYVESSSPKQ